MKSMNTSIDITWKKIGDIKQKMRKAKQELNQTRVNVMDLRYQYLLQRASAKNLENKTRSFKTIIDIQKIERIIEMWKNIRFIMIDREDILIKTIDILLDFVYQME